MTTIIAERVGTVGYLTLNSPATLNALTLDMVQALRTGLSQHQDDSQVGVIVLRSAVEKAFCAGGHMKRIRELQLEGNTTAIEQFFTEEYALNIAIAQCAKPYVSLVDGVAMGGGLGLSVHGSHLVATEKAMMAMPESRIGFSPDVGASYFLHRLPKHSGTWLGLTAAPVRGAQTVICGLATHFAQRENLPALMQCLEEIDLTTLSSDNAKDRISRELDAFCDSAEDPEFDNQMNERSAWFEGFDAKQIHQRLQNSAEDNTDAKHLLELLNAGSPHSVKTTLSLLKSSLNLPLADCLSLEKELAVKGCTHPDFIEGVRAVLVDKDKNPNWQSS